MGRRFSEPPEEILEIARAIARRLARENFRRMMDGVPLQSTGDSLPVLRERLGGTL